MKYIKPVLRGMCIAIMAAAAGVESFSPQWWLFMVAGCVLSELAPTRAEGK